MQPPKLLMVPSQTAGASLSASSDRFKHCGLYLYRSLAAACQVVKTGMLGHKGVVAGLKGLQCCELGSAVFPQAGKTLQLCAHLVPDTSGARQLQCLASL
jgi:hypothetical protein